MNNLEVQNENIVINNNQKNIGISLLLTFFLGPFGMLYSTITGFIVMLIFNIFLGIITVIGLFLLPILGLFISIFSLLILWIVQIVWGIIAVNNYNSIHKTQNISH